MVLRRYDRHSGSKSHARFYSEISNRVQTPLEITASQAILAADNAHGKFLSQPSALKERLYVTEVLMPALEALYQAVKPQMPIKAAISIYNTQRASILSKFCIPDVIAALGDADSPSIADVLWIADAKLKNLDDAARGQLFDYLTELLELDPSRSRAFGFLISYEKRQIIMCRAERAGDDINYAHTKELPLDFVDGNGYKQLQGLFCFSETELGRIPWPSVPGYIVQRAMGHGASAIVWEVQSRDSTISGPVVYKQYLSSLSATQKKHLIQAETAMYSFGTPPESLPALVGRVGDDGVLLSPLLAPLSSTIFRGRYVKDIIDAMRYLHTTCKRVHRDIRWANIMVRKNLSEGNDTAVLIDHGFSTSRDSLALFEGGGFYASAAVLDALTTNSGIPPEKRSIKFTANDDVEAFIHVLYLIAVNGERYVLRYCDTYAEAKSFWQERLKSPIWQEALTAARTTPDPDYDKIVTLFGQFFAP